ncbi:MAG: response regulator transcription factor [Verrucomicrobiota bacterium]
MRQVLIVDDHALIRIGLGQFVRQTFGVVNVVEAETAQAAMVWVRKQSWDLILLDIDLPDRSGMDILDDIKRERPTTPVLFLTGAANVDFAQRVMRSGASGYVEKGGSADELRTAITTVLDGRRYICPRMAEAMALQNVNPSGPPRVEALSDREFQVLRLMGAGKAVSEIGEELSLSVKTVSTYRARLLEKLGLDTTAALVRYAIKNNLVK